MVTVMKASRLKTKIEIYRPSKASDGFGEEVKTYTKIAEEFAGVEPISAKEAFGGGQIYSEVDTKIILRTDTVIALRDKAVDMITGFSYIVKSSPIKFADGSGVELLAKYYD